MFKFNPYLASLLILSSSFTAAAANTVGKRTSPLPDSLWNRAQWISVRHAPTVQGVIKAGNERAADGASWFMTDIRNNRKIAKAVWMTTGLGVYHLYVNGHPVGNEVLKPGFTHRDKTKLSFTYDITDALDCREGKVNRLAVQSTPGWWADKIVTPAKHKGMYGDKPAFKGVLLLTMTDGTKQLLTTNPDDWKAGIAGPVTHASIFDGEEYDARNPMGYYTPQLMSRPEIHNVFNGEILPSDGAEVYLRNDLKLTPVEIYVWKEVAGKTDQEYGTVIKERVYKPGERISLHKGEYLVVDFGQNCAGVPAFKFKGKKGVQLSGFPAELLNDGNGAKSRGMDGPEGSVHRLNLRTPKDAMLLKYTFGSEPGYVEYTPSCTFYGYRFISFTATGDVTIESIASIPVTSITKGMETGHLTTGNESINKLISNTLWGQRSNYLSVPTDCPQRNERLGWTADTQVFAETGSFFADTRKFMHKWMRDMRDSRNDQGSFPGVAPTAQYGDCFARVGWADAGVIVPWVIWKQYADTAIVRENWEAMEKFMNHIADTRYDHTKLVGENGNYQWADWLSYEALESNSRRGFAKDDKGNILKDKTGMIVALPETYEYWSYLGACYWLADAVMMRDMASAIGADAAKYDSMIADARSYILSRFLNDKGEFKAAVLNTMQTPALFALHNNLVEGDARTNMIARLRKNFEEHDNCLQTGFLGTAILMQTLTDNGMTDIAYELLLQRKNPSWLYSVDNGATTIWERWNSYMLDKGMGPRGMNSFNHYAYGCVCEWMWKSMAGISADISEPGFRRIIMAPHPDPRIGFVKAEYRSPAGLIKSHWRYEGNRWIWDFTIPKGTTALVTLPTTTTTLPTTTTTLPTNTTNNSTTTTNNSTTNNPTTREYPAGTHRITLPAR